MKLKIAVCDDDLQWSERIRQSIYYRSCGSCTARLSIWCDALHYEAGYDNITTAQKQLEPYGFVRIHQSFLVNMKYIQKISGYHVYLTTHKDLPATKARYQEVKDQFFEYIEYDSEG